MRTNPHCHLSTSVKHTNTAPPTTTLELIEMTENDIGDDIKTKFAISFNHCTSQETFNGIFSLMQCNNQRYSTNKSNVTM